MAVAATVNRKKKIFYFLNYKIVHVDKNYRQEDEFHSSGNVHMLHLA